MLIVFGSINIDLSIAVDHLPRPGETVLSDDYAMRPGGKGANQALAAARSGAKTALVGKIGDDNMGARILSSIRRQGVMTSGVAESDLPTGCAVVSRDPNGENQIIVATGANMEARAEQVPDEVLNEGTVVLMQMEVPREENWILLERAKERGATTILNLAPAITLPQQALENLDYLIVNEIEARQIAKILGLTVEENIFSMAATLSRAGNLTCIITLGAEGSITVTAEGKAYHTKALALEDIVDISGAGDCYCGTFAACLHEGMDLHHALKRASVAASLCCEKAGTQESYPYISEIDENYDRIADPEEHDI